MVGQRNSMLKPVKSGYPLHKRMSNPLISLKNPASSIAVFVSAWSAASKACERE